MAENTQIILGTHGLGAIKLSGTNLEITNDHGSASITTSSQGNGQGEWLHFTIPPPESQSLYLRSAAVSFRTTGSADIDNIRVYLGNSLIQPGPGAKFAPDNTKTGKSIDLTATKYNGEGILVSLRVTVAPNFKVSLQSVKVAFADYADSS